MRLVHFQAFKEAIAPFFANKAPGAQTDHAAAGARQGATRRPRGRAPVCLDLDGLDDFLFLAWPKTKSVFFPRQFDNAAILYL